MMLLCDFSNFLYFAYENLEEHNKTIQALRDYYVAQVEEKIPYIHINGVVALMADFNSSKSKIPFSFTPT